MVEGLEEDGATLRRGRELTMETVEEIGSISAPFDVKGHEIVLMLTYLIMRSFFQ